MHDDHQTDRRPLELHLRNFAVRSRVLFAVMAVCGILLLFVTDVSAIHAAMIAGSGVFGVVFYTRELRSNA